MRKKAFYKIISVILAVLFVCSSMNLKVNAEDNNADLMIKDDEIKKRNETLLNVYGISYEDLYNQYPASLSSDTVPLSIVRDTGSEAANELSGSDLFFAAMMEALNNESSALSYTYRNVFGRFSDSVATPYEKQLDDLTILYVNEVFENETTLTNIIRKTEDRFKVFKTRHAMEKVQEAFDKDDFNFFIDLYYKDVTTAEELRQIKEKMMGAQEYITVNYKDAFSLVEYYLFLIESYQVNYDIVEKLYSLQPKDSLLAEGLKRYLDNYKTLFLPKLLDQAVSEVFINKFASALIQKSVDSYYLAGPWEVISIIIKLLDFYYEKHLPSAQDITRYFLMDGFLSSIDRGLLQLRTKMASDLSSGRKVSYDYINDYEFLYDTKIKTMKMYLEAAYDITKSPMFSKEETDLQTRIKALIQTMEEDYDFDYYVDMCARNATGEEITEADFPITYVVCKINKDETLTLDKRKGKLVAIYKDINGKEKELNVVGNKLFGGVRLNGGTLIVKSDARISGLTIYGGTIELPKGITLITDKLKFDYGIVYIGTGTIESISDITSSGCQKVVGNGGELKTSKNFISDSRAGTSFSNMTLTVYGDINCRGTYRDFYDKFDNIVCNGDISGRISIENNVVVNGDALCDSLMIKDGFLVADEINVRSLSIINGKIKTNGNLSYSNDFSCEGKDSVITVLGNLYANGYSGFYGGLSGYKLLLTGGVLELYGNLIAAEDKKFEGVYREYVFRPDDDFVLKLCGDEKQYLYLPGSSGTIPYLITQNEDVEFLSDIVIEKLDGNLNITKSDYVLNIKDAQGNMVTMNTDPQKAVTVLNGSYYQKGNSYGRLILSGVGMIDGDINSGISVENGEYEVHGAISGSVGVTDGILKQISSMEGKDKINCSDLSLRNGILESAGDVTYTSSFRMKEDSKLTVNGTFYAKGYSDEPVYQYSDELVYRTHYLVSGTIEILGDLFVKENEEKYVTFNPTDECMVYFLDGDHLISSVSKLKIANLGQSENSTITFDKSGHSITNLATDIVTDSSQNYTIQNWNKHIVTNLNVPEGNVKSYPRDYAKITKEIDLETGLKTFVYQPANATNWGTSLEIDKTNINLCIGTSDVLHGSLNIDNETLQYQWSSDDENIVSVDHEGNLVANALGQTTITFSVEGLDAECSCLVTVNDHDWEENKIIKEPTHEETGEIEYKCKNCDAVKIEELQVTDHELELFPEKKPTIYAEGNIAYYRCKLCGKLYLDELASTEITEEDTVLDKLQSVNVTICVVDQDSNPLTEVDVKLNMKDNEDISYLSKTNENGEVSFEIASGDYTIVLEGEGISIMQTVTFKPVNGEESISHTIIVNKVSYIPEIPETSDTQDDSDSSVDSNDSNDSNASSVLKETPCVNINYRTHVQTYGWQSYVSNGAMAGTEKQAKRLEGININVVGNSNLGVQYTTHVQSYGWLPWASNDDMSGTEGEAKRLEAIKIQLTGADKDKYDIYYRVHAQSYGWLGWAKNGAPAGTAGYAKRLEGIQILVVKKGEKIDQNQGGITSTRSEAYIALAGSSPVVGAAATSNADPTIGGAANPNVSYRTHVQSFGWQGWKYNGQMSGTSGQAKRLEGINIKLTNKPYSGGICYTTHVQSYGWQGDINNSTTWKKDGEMAGTSGQAKRLEAIMIKLTGEMAEHYDVYYRVHAQSYGWMGWAKNGEPAGTAGYAKRLEGIQIVLVPKGGAAPANNYGGINSANGQAYIKK